MLSWSCCAEGTIFDYRFANADEAAEPLPGNRDFIRNHRTMMKPQSADIINWKKAEDDPSF